MLIPQKFFTAPTNSKQSKTCGIEAGHLARDIFALSVTVGRRLKMNPARTFWPKRELLASVRKAEGSAKKIMWRLIRGQEHYEVGRLFGITADEVIRIVYKVVNGEEYPIKNIRVAPMEEVIQKPKPEKKQDQQELADDYSRVMVLSVRGFKPREIAQLTKIPISSVYRYRHKIRHGKR